MTTTRERQASGALREGSSGTGQEAEPTTPGSYGLAPSGFRLPAETRLGPVRLQVADIERSLAFYEGVLGMRRLDREGWRAVLGAQAAEGGTAGAESGLVELVERQGTRPAPGRGRTGLFHFALLLPDRSSLGRFARHVRDLGLPVGAGDHRVSEALYLHDPDRLGIEVYADRSRESWQHRGRELVMTTDPLDRDGLMAASGEAPWTGLPAGTVLGHLHLHVGDLAAARAFYSDALGFDTTVWSYPGALFFGAGGYHHHLGTNVWAGPGTTPPAEDEARLLDWTVELPHLESLAAAAESLEHAGYPAEHREDPLGGTEVATRDPWGTRLLLALGPASGSQSNGGRDSQKSRKG